jgi:preprotein translocase subunit SecG
MLYSILVAIDVLLAIGIIGLILIQHGKGADVGAAFGSGASGTVFGAQGSASFLTRVTAVLATLFFVNSLALAYLASHRPVAESVINSVEQTTIENKTDKDSSNLLIPNDIPSSDLPSEDMDTMKSDIPLDIETKTDADASKPVDKVQDSIDSVKKEIKGATKDAAPNDVPE